MDYTNINKKIIITFAKRLRNSAKYKTDFLYAKLPIDVSSSLYKVIRENFEPKFLLLITILAAELRESENPEVTLDRIINNLKIFLIVEIGSKEDEVRCFCDEGSFPCDECSTGTIQCDRCEGSGVEFDAETGEEVDCEKCAGFAEVACEYCAGEGYYECSECSGVGSYHAGSFAQITPKSFYTLDKKFIETYSELTLNTNDEESEPVECGNIIPKNSYNFQLVEDFYVDYDQYGTGVINFDIKEEYYNGSYLLGIFDLFNPYVTITLNGPYFIIKFFPKIESILEDNFT